MNTSLVVRNILLILIGTMLVSGCSGAAPQPVAALAAATDTPQVIAPVVPTEAPAEVIAPAAAPTEIIAPSAPTPTRMQFAVQNDSLEIKVVGIERPHIVDLGIDANLDSQLVFTPGEGNMFLSLGIKVTNKTGSDIPLKWTDVYIVNKYEDKWYPVWGVYKKTNTAIDPLTIEILEFDQVHPDFDPDAHMYVSDNGYLRVIFQIPRDNLYYYFGMTDLPLIEINWRYY